MDEKKQEKQEKEFKGYVLPVVLLLARKYPQIKIWNYVRFYTLDGKDLYLSLTELQDTFGFILPNVDKFKIFQNNMIKLADACRFAIRLRRSKGDHALEYYLDWVSARVRYIMAGKSVNAYIKWFDRRMEENDAYLKASLSI